MAYFTKRCFYQERFRPSSCVPLGLGILCFLANGCGPKPQAQAWRWADPLQPQAAPGIIEELRRCEKDSGCPLVADIVLAYANTGRDFREPAGPDGYVLRVIPLDRRMRPARVQADVEIGLFPEDLWQETGLEAEPVRTWRISAGDLEKYWAETNLLDSYIFRLDWGASGVPQGQYRLLVRLSCEGEDSLSGQCRTIDFQDLAPREVADTAAEPAQAETEREMEP